MTQQTGIILLDKPAGISSAKAIAQVKYKLKLDKIGHAGTLDPFATGLLVCLLGRATKLADYAEKGEKVYTGIIQFGIATDTDDLTGKIIKESAVPVNFDSLEKIIAEKFSGVIEQYPPRVSAIKINGERAYKLARAGEDFEVPKRKVQIHEFSAKILSANQLSFRIKCSVGTYIRSIARDLGECLNACACLAELRRESSHPFAVENATLIENVSAINVLSWECLFPDAGRLEFDEKLCWRLQNGQIQALAEIQSEFGSQIKDFKKLIFYSKNDVKPLGLLLNNGTSLEFGFVG